MFNNWVGAHGITIDYVNPGGPYQNGYIERFNRTYRTEILALYLFNHLKQVRKITEEWLTIYNTERPHEALNNTTPLEYKIPSVIFYVNCVLRKGIYTINSILLRQST